MDPKYVLISVDNELILFTSTQIFFIRKVNFKNEQHFDLSMVIVKFSLKVKLACNIYRKSTKIYT